jgi:hypothetical protein
MLNRRRATLRAAYKILIGVGVAIITIVLALGYFGLVPGVSRLFGSDLPRDLGVTYTETDLASALKKIGTEVQNLPPDGATSLAFSGQKTASFSLTEAEVSALCNGSWKYHPLSDCQVNLLKDGYAEFSGKLLTDRLEEYTKAMGVDQGHLELLNNYSRYIQGSPRIYIKARGAISNNQVVGLDIAELQIGRITFSQSTIQDNQAAIASFVNWQLGRIPGLAITSATLVGNQIKFEGMVPAVKQVATQ